jgi:hypothetical protein
LQARSPLLGKMPGRTPALEDIDVLLFQRTRGQELFGPARVMATGFSSLLIRQLVSGLIRWPPSGAAW